MVFDTKLHITIVQKSRYQLNKSALIPTLIQILFPDENPLY